jgi:hypothetical protein
MPDLDPTVIATEGSLEALQVGIVRMLQSDTALAAAKILHEDEGEIENKIESSLSEQGLILLVMAPEGRSDSPDAACIILDELKVVVRIIEIPLINRDGAGTRIPINRAVELVARSLHQRVIGGHTLVFERFEPDRQAETPTKDVTFSTTLQFEQ